MKKIILTTVLIMLFTGCKTSKTNNSIPYILPRDIEHKLYDNIKDKPNTIFCFLLTQKKFDTFEITIIETNKKNFKATDSFDYIEKSNRKLLINDTFYPLVYRLDYHFGTDMKKTKLMTLLERDERERKYHANRKIPETTLFRLHRNWIIAEGYSITFDKKGNIIKE